MIAPNEPVVALLSLDSLRIVRTAQHTIEWSSGTRGPTEREAGGPRLFARVVPWPPVPGLAATIVWDFTAERVRGTRTGIIVAAWAVVASSACWTSSRSTVLEDGAPIFTALTAEAAHALATSLASAPTRAEPRSDLFNARSSTLLAGADPLGTATTSSSAAFLAQRLNCHPAVDLLAPGIAVAADPTVGGYQIDATWQMRDGPGPWTHRVARAALNLGAVIDVTGTIDDWQWTGSYRHVRCSASGTAARVDVTVERRPVASPVDTIRGPLAALSVAIDHIDAIGDADLIEIALARTQ